MAGTHAYAISLEDVKEAAERVRGKVHRTPVLTCETLDKLASANGTKRLYFKCENLQKIGAFKARGATNAVQAMLADPELAKTAREKGFVTHSSGNHGQALAFASRAAGVPCTVVVPRGSAAAKVDAMRGYGANVVFSDNNQKAREAKVAEVQAETGAILVHPYEDPYVMAGQGTLMLELLEQAKAEHGVDLDAVIVPLGGGGMLAGCCVAGKGVRPDLRIFAAEPHGADDGKRSFVAKERRTLEEVGGPKTIADGLRTNVGRPNFPIIMETIEDVFVAEEDEIVKAMRLIFERAKIVIEPSAAVGPAVAFYNEDFRKLEGLHNVGIVICGGNTDLDALPWVSKP